MATLVNNGWLYIDDGTDDMKLACKRITWNKIRNPDFTDYAGGGHTVFDNGEFSIVFRAKDILFKNEADYETFVDKINDWQDAGTFDLRITKDGTNFKKPDGNNTRYPVNHLGIEEAEDVVGGKTSFFRIKQVVFRLAGTPLAS